MVKILRSADFRTAYLKYIQKLTRTGLAFTLRKEVLAKKEEAGSSFRLFLPAMLTRDLILSGTNLEVFHEQEENLLHVRWKGYAESVEFRNVIENVLKLVSDLQISFLLIDIKLMEALSRSDQEWLIKEYYPRLGKTGVQKKAIISSLDHFNNAAFNRQSGGDESSGFEKKFFVDEERARKWLFNLI